MDAQAYQEMMQRQKMEELKRGLLGNVFTKDALERLGRVRLANPQLAEQVELYLISVYQQGKLQQLVTDEKLRDVLQLVGQKREPSIRRV